MRQFETKLTLRIYDTKLIEKNEHDYEVQSEQVSE